MAITTSIVRSSRSRTVLTNLLIRQSTLKGSKQRRWNSSQPPPPPTAGGAKLVSPTAAFYKTFTRPVAKVLLMAIFTYQFAYWAWVKLEKDEIKRKRNAEIETLEEKLRDLTGKGVP